MRYLVLLLLALSLGCISQGEAPARDYGVIIRAFEPDISEVKTGNDVNVRLQVENAGDFDAENVKAWIFNCGDFINCDAVRDFRTLSKADLKASLPGESKETFWKIKSDRLMSENERLVQDIGVKVEYNYDSSAVAEIPVVSQDRYRELERLGKLSSSRVESSLSPVSVKITAPSIVVGSEQFTVKIDLEKTSDGFVEGCGGTTGCIDSVKIVPSSGIRKVDGGCADATNFNLWRSGSASMTCVLKADATCGSECHPTVKVTAKYRFVVEKTTSVTVIGTGVAVPSGGGGVVPPVSAVPSIALSPSSARVDEDITVVGSGYKPDSDIQIYLEGGMLIDNAVWIKEAEVVRKLDAVAVSPVTKDGGVRTDSTGSFTAKIRLPFDSVRGQLYVYALVKDSRPEIDFINSIKQPIDLKKVAYIESVSKEDMLIGEQITFTGNGFMPNEDDIRVYLAKPSEITKDIKSHTLLEITTADPKFKGSVKGSLKATSGGYIEGSFIVPSKGASDYSLYGLGSMAGKPEGYTIKQAWNGRKVVTIDFKGIQTDSDEDGVPDLTDTLPARQLDLCPHTPIGIPVGSDGCPLIFVSMLGSGTCDYKRDGNADIVLRIENSAGSRVYDIYGFIKDSISGEEYPTDSVARTFEPDEAFDAKGTVTGLADGRHKITGIIYAGSGLKEINRTEGLEFEVQSNDCPEVKINSAKVTPEHSALADPVTINVDVENTGRFDVDDLNVSVVWTLKNDGRVLGRDECIFALDAKQKKPCIKTRTDFTDFPVIDTAFVSVKEMRGPAGIELDSAEASFDKSPA